MSSDQVEAFAKENLLGPDFTFNHAQRPDRCRLAPRPRDGLQRQRVSAVGRAVRARAADRPPASADFRRRSISACSQGSASTTRRRTARTCSARCVRRSSSSARSRRIAGQQGSGCTGAGDRASRSCECATVERRAVCRVARQVRHADARQGGGHRHDPGRRHQRVSVEQRASAPLSRQQTFTTWIR